MSDWDEDPWLYRCGHGHGTDPEQVGHAWTVRGSTPEVAEHDLYREWPGRSQTAIAREFARRRALNAAVCPDCGRSAVQRRRWSEVDHPFGTAAEACPFRLRFRDEPERLVVTESGVSQFWTFYGSTIDLHTGERVRVEAELVEDWWAAPLRVDELPNYLIERWPHVDGKPVRPGRRGGDSLRDRKLDGPNIAWWQTQIDAGVAAGVSRQGEQLGLFSRAA